MEYGKHIIDADMVYSIDFLQIDFNLGALSEKLKSLLFGSLDLEMISNRCELECASGVKNLAKYDLHWWQFGGLHVEIWPKSVTRDIGVPRPDEDGDLQPVSALQKEIYWYMRMKFNPNKNTSNPTIKRIIDFFTKSGWVGGWHFTRIDYAIDVQGSLSDFYVLSRKTETNFGSTRYYGVRGQSGYLRVYDKRKEQLEVEKSDIGFELTRFEWEQRGNRDFDFTFDQFSRMDFSGLDGPARTLRYVSPELINSALLEFSINIRTKIKKKLFSPVTVKKELFQDLLAQYVNEYHLQEMRVFTDSQLWAMEQAENET